MNYKIVTDSGANLTDLPGVTFENVPITIMADKKEYRDDRFLDVTQMITDLSQLTTKSSTACPNIDQWMRAYAGADIVIVFTLTGALSGSYSAAVQARELYLEEHPEAKIFVLDSTSAGPRMELLIHKAVTLINEGVSFDGIKQALTLYLTKTKLIFSLESLTNLVNNGRVSRATAKVANLLKLRIVGTDTEGKLTPLGKARGQAKALSLILNEMEASGFTEGKVCIAHCLNEAGAKLLAEKIKAQHPKAQITLTKTRGICSYYAEQGGLMVGFECL